MSTFGAYRTDVDTLLAMNTPVTELIGIYDADSTLIGEVSYWIGARLGRRHCSLCELTHGVFTVKPEWTSCSRSLAVPFLTFHRNDAPSDVLGAAMGSFPVVLARTPSQILTVMDHHMLGTFNGSTENFVDALSQWLKTRGSAQDGSRSD